MTDQLTPFEEDSVLAAEYTLRLLSDDEEAAFEARLAEDRNLEGEVAEWVRQLAPLSDEIAPVAPPKSAKARLMTDLFGAPAETAPASAGFGLWKVLTFLASGVAAVLAVMLVMQPTPETPAAGPLYVSEIVAEDDSLRVLAVYDGSSGDLRLTGTAGTAATGRDFELWAIICDDAPVSLGVLTDDGTGNIRLPEALQGAIGGMVLAISDEPDGGSPTGAPTGAVLASGQVTDI